MRALVLHVRLHDGRYHGEGDWPPSPARLFQALVAGAGLGGPIDEADKAALQWLEKQGPPLVASPFGPSSRCSSSQWLEKQGPPLVAAPLAQQQQRGVLFYMPNNDSDAIGGDPLKAAKIRTATKVFRPYLFDPSVPFMYVWFLRGHAGDEDQAGKICLLAERLYQLGRGLDMAWAWGEVLDEDALEKVLAGYPGRLFRPSAGRSDLTLSCPCPGSLDSLDRRYRGFRERFRYRKEGKSVRVVFRKPPPPRFQQTPYDSRPVRRLYELRSPTDEGKFAPWPLTRASDLVVRLRDGAVRRLKKALPGSSGDIERVLVGRKPDGTNDGSPEDRVRIIPLPSIGHVHADRQIRRVLVEVPPTSPLRADDVHWAFAGLDLIDMETGEICAVLTRADDERFVRHYGLAEIRDEDEWAYLRKDERFVRHCGLAEDGGYCVWRTVTPAVRPHVPSSSCGPQGYCVWRTVTPAVLPEQARRRRIDPARRSEEAKGGEERFKEVLRAAEAVLQALRHARVRAEVEAIRVQREPFEGKGARVEPFVQGTRFDKHRVWHVEITFQEPIPGPLVIGDGRFLGLGVMAPPPMHERSEGT